MGKITGISWTDSVLRKRFWAKVRCGLPNECWEWIGAKTSGGYGVFAVGRFHTTAHRVSYAIANGEIPNGLQVDHLCRNRACVNPRHLEAVTNQENTLRGARGRLITSCKHGHPYTPENTLLDKQGRRDCRECRRLHDRERHNAAYWRAYRKARKEEQGGQNNKDLLV